MSKSILVIDTPNGCYDCQLVDEKITDDKSFQEADSGLIFYYMDRILEALKK